MDGCVQRYICVCVCVWQGSPACVLITLHLPLTTPGRRLNTCTQDHWIRSLLSPCLSVLLRYYIIIIISFIISPVIIVIAMVKNWIISKMTCNVLMGTLNPAHSLSHWRCDFDLITCRLHVTRRAVCTMQKCCISLKHNMTIWHAKKFSGRCLWTEPNV